MRWGRQTAKCQNGNVYSMYDGHHESGLVDERESLNLQHQFGNKFYMLILQGMAAWSCVAFRTSFRQVHTASFGNFTVLCPDCSSSPSLP